VIHHTAPARHIVVGKRIAIILFIASFVPVRIRTGSARGFKRINLQKNIAGVEVSALNSLASRW
jgi:hypothetical protein